MSMENLIRCVEERIAVEYSKQQMKTPIHLCIGQEKICADVCSKLTPQDPMFAYYRSHGWYLAKGGNLDRMIAELYGKSNGCSGGFGGSMHLVDLDAGFHGTSAIVGSQFAHAVGLALSKKIQHQAGTAVCVFGDGATEEGSFAESLMFAAVHELDIVFICINDGMASATPIRTRQPINVPIWQRALAMGCQSSAIRQEDPGFSPKAAMVRALEHTRFMKQPYLLEIQCKRECAHVGPDGVSLATIPTEENKRAIELAFQRAWTAPFPGGVYS